MPHSKPTSTSFAPTTLFGKFLLNELLSSGLYIGEFAEKIGVHYRTLVRFFETDDLPSFDVLWTISDRLDINFLMLVAVVHPKYVQKIAKLQTRSTPSEAEQRLIDSGILPTDMTDFMRGVLSREVEERIVDALMVIESAAYLLGVPDKSTTDKEQLLELHDKHAQKIKRLLGAIPG